MFDFQKLEVYKKAKALNRDILVLLSENKFDRHINDQLKRATFSILLNLAEGSSRFSNADRRRFMIMARGSVFECVAVIDFLVDNKLIDQTTYHDFFRIYASSPYRIHAIFLCETLRLLYEPLRYFSNRMTIVFLARSQARQLFFRLYASTRPRIYGFSSLLRIFALSHPRNLSTEYERKLSLCF